MFGELKTSNGNSFINEFSAKVAVHEALLINPCPAWVVIFIQFFGAKTAIVAFVPPCLTCFPHLL